MAIKTAVVLACTGGIDYTQFRLLTDVERFSTQVELALKTCLSNLRKESRFMNQEEAGSLLASYSHAPLKVNKYLTVLHELFDKVAQLDSIYAMLVSGFGHMPKAQALVTRTQALIVYVRNRVDKALDQLSQAVDRHQPEFYQHCCQALISKAQRVGGFESLTPLSMLRAIVEPGTENVVATQFTTYLCFKNLTDASGYVHARYHVVVTCLVDKFGRFNMNYSLQPNLLLPGRFRSANHFDSAKQGWEMICNSMREEGFAWGTP